MIGNDVIDLTLAGKESDWKRKGFLQKVFTADEQNLIPAFFNPDLMVWLLWSMKESVYKIYVQEYSERMLAPLKFKCRLTRLTDPDVSGEVLFAGKVYKTFSAFSAQRISTTAFSDCGIPQNMIAGDFEFASVDYCSRKKEMINHFILSLSEQINKPFEEFSIIKDVFNVPCLLFKERLLPASISFSHHGRYGGYAAEIF